MTSLQRSQSEARAFMAAALDSGVDSCDSPDDPPPGRGSKAREPHEYIDGWLATRLKQARLERGLSQDGLAAKLGISLQQVHKYEAGRNRISASRLAEIAVALDKPLDDFFKGLDVFESADAAPGGDARASADSPNPGTRPGLESWPLDRGRECLELVRNFEQIEDPERRRAILDLLRQVSGSY